MRVCMESGGRGEGANRCSPPGVHALHAAITCNSRSPRPPRQMTGGSESVVGGRCDERTWHPDLDWLEGELAGPSPPRMVVIVNPCNPTGVCARGCVWGGEVGGGEAAHGSCALILTAFHMHPPLPHISMRMLFYAQYAHENKPSSTTTSLTGIQSVACKA
jgi:hypothetical protein